MENKTRIGLVIVVLFIILAVSGAIKKRCGDGVCQRFEKKWKRCPSDCEPIKNKAVPNKFGTLYTKLNWQLSKFEESLTVNTSKAHRPIFAAELLTANANRGKDLLKPETFPGVLKELNRLQELGVEGVVVAVNFPLLYPGFHKSPAEQNEYLNFYRNVSKSIRLKGMKLIIENNFIFTGEGISTLNTRNFYKNLSRGEYLKERSQVALTIAKELHPDYLTIVIEPDTEAAQTKKAINDVSIQTNYIKDVLTMLKKNKITDVKVGAGVGTWHPKYKEFIESFANTDIDYLDTHIYPINKDFLERAITIANIAHSKGKSVTISEAWLFKIDDRELGRLPETDIFSRDVFDFWQPLDEKFLEILTKLAYAKNFDFISPFWTKYFFAYLNYNEVGKKPPSELILLSSKEASKNILNGTFTQTGLKYKELIKQYLVD